MTFRDDDLLHLAANGLPALPAADRSGHVDHAEARIWYAVFGEGRPVILLHGGLGHSGNWVYQVEGLARAGYQVIVIDSRGHGRSTLGPHPLSYDLMASDLRAVMDALGLERAPIVGWSDGADTGLIAAMQTPERVAGLLFFACNVDGSGTRPFVMTPVIERILAVHKQGYATLSPTPEGFDKLMAVTGEMQGSQPNLSAGDLKGIDVPVTVVIGEDDEFITRAHMAYLAATLPRASLRVLDGVTHFAPLQDPGRFTATIVDFLAGLPV